MKMTPHSKQKTPVTVVIVGPGRWGRALGGVFLQNNERVGYLGPDSTERHWSTAFQNRPLCVIACPFKEIESVLKKIPQKNCAGILNASKGIDRKTLLTFSRLASHFLKIPFATLSGPTFAAEVSAGRPSACVLAGTHSRFVDKAAARLSTPNFRVYTSDDPIGVEVCGAMKNVLAIACGVSDGLKLGLNARAALLTRGLNEMLKAVTMLGGKASSVFGLAGVGDLWLTATGDLSRNRQLGLWIAKGLSIDQALSKLSGPSEGFYTVHQIVKLAKKHRLSLPISEEVLKLLQNKQTPQGAIRALMSRKRSKE